MKTRIYTLLYLLIFVALPAYAQDDLTGLYRMVRPSSVARSGYYVEHLVFLPGGKLYRGVPPEGLQYFDIEVAQRAHPDRYGTYQIKNGAIHILLGPNKTPYVITRNGERLNNPPSLGKGSFRPVPACDGLKLEGSYRRNTSEPTITFTSDGKFRDGGIFRYFGSLENPDGTMYMDDGTGGHGTYSIRQNTLELKYADGHTRRILIQVFPEQLAKQPVVPALLLREERLERY